MKTKQTQTQGTETMKATYGIKRINGTTTRILTDAQGFIAPMFVGVGTTPAKTWKTHKGAERAARQHTDSEVFPITDIMHY